MAGETRVGILEQGTFSELHIERDSDRSVTGTVTLGKVTRVLPGMQAAFVDIGLDKAAFLYVGDYLDETGHLEADDDNPRPRRSRGGRNGSYRQPPRIDTLLREGQEIIVQVAKDPIGTKGARITSHVSIAGRHLVLTPWSKRVGVSAPHRGRQGAPPAAGHRHPQPSRASSVSSSGLPAMARPTRTSRPT